MVVCSIREARNETVSVHARVGSQGEVETNHWENTGFARTPRTPACHPWPSTQFAFCAAMDLGMKHRLVAIGIDR